MNDVGGEVVGVIYKDKNIDLTDRKIFDDHGDEICKLCPWNKDSHHPDASCEAYHCGEAVEIFLEQEVGSMKNKLNEIRERVENATQGPWELREDNFNGKRIYVFIRSANKDERDIDLNSYNAVSDVSGDLTKEDGVFITHARQDITYLLELLQQTQDKLDRTEEAWELEALKKLTYCENEPNKSIIKINQELKVELQQSLARERVFRETLKKLY